MNIKIIDGKWHVNGKQFSELTPNEILILDNFFEDYKNGNQIPSDIIIEDSALEILKYIVE